MIAVDAARLDRLPEPEFVALMAPLFEGAPRFLARLAAGRPFGSTDRLFERALEIALAMPDDEQRELIDAHPRLGAPPGSVSPMSYVEQSYDQEAAGAEAEAERRRVAAELARLNDAYEARFGFRYCVFVAGRPRDALIPEFEAALHADSGAERRRALGDVVAIARARHASLAGSEIGS
jgi:2-oxo-4-hydroxy-4-carboxy--5-ureidoimidazoline (OHCU) decarboxylase